MKRYAALAAGMCLAFAAWAAEDVTVSGAWVRATAPGQDSAAVALTITSAHDARLVAVDSPVAEHSEIHTMKHESGMMMMRQVDSLALPAGRPVSLGAGDHLMLVGLKQPLKAGDSVPLKLTVESGKHKEIVAVSAEVRTSAPGHDMHDMHDMDGMHMH